MKTQQHDYATSDLVFEFNKACITYKDALRSRESNRSNKELTKGNTKGTNIHKFQCSFAWIVHGMTMGHYSGRGRLVDEGKALILHIINISE